MHALERRQNGTTGNCKQPATTTYPPPRQSTISHIISSVDVGFAVAASARHVEAGLVTSYKSIASNLQSFLQNQYVLLQRRNIRNFLFTVLCITSKLCTGIVIGTNLILAFDSQFVRRTFSTDVVRKKKSWNRIQTRVHSTVVNRPFLKRGGKG